MKENKLKTLDFREGIRASDVNYNFDIIRGWVERERLRTSGWGIVEGFDFSYPNDDFVIHIGEGTYINKNGEEQFVDTASISCGAPKYETITEEVIVSDDGRIRLKYVPYSPSRYGLIEYFPPSENVKPLTSELSVIDRDAPSMKMPIITVVGNMITVSAPDFAGKTAKVTYRYCDDRIDAILLGENGLYYREIGINSTSPSKTDLDLTNKYIIGFAHWIVGKTITVEFITEGRTYRPVYTDSNNVLYLNGEVYKKPKFIYFTEPEEPQPDDMWYDRDNNLLMAWELSGGVYGWRVVNDFTSTPLREVKIWTANNFPSDGMTFKFRDDETNLRFIPGTHALDIIIDQQIVMEDQFSELVMPGAQPYLSSGIGFKLNAPLDRSTVVQAIIHHSVKNAPLRNVFQRAAIFVYENFQVYSTSNPNRIFHTNLEYALLDDQIEVFVNGERLNKNTDFVELRDDGITLASNGDENKMSHYFKVVKTLSPGDKVTYKLSRHVWSYDQLNTFVDEIKKTAEDALALAEQDKKDIQTLEANISTQLGNLRTKISSIEQTLQTLNQYRKKTDKIAIADLNADVKEKIYNNFQMYSFSATAPVGDSTKIQNVTQKDCIFVSYVSEGFCSQLTLGQNADYIVSYNAADKTAHILLNAELQASGAVVIVNVIRFGI